MFTGIVEGVGTVNKISKITKNRSAIEMTIDLGKQVKGLKIGQSVALNGVCLTATKLSKSKCIFEMIEETTKKTDLGNLKVGGVVNIERSLNIINKNILRFILSSLFLLFSLMVDFVYFCFLSNSMLYRLMVT
mgnify:CR=1 FL=1